MMKLPYFFYMRKMVWLLPWILLFNWGCPGNPADEETSLFQEAVFNYDQGLNTLYFAVQMEPSYLGQPLLAVNSLYFGFDSTQTADSLILNDGGAEGDIIMGDGVYSIKVTNDENHVSYVLAPTDTGTVYVKFVAQYGSDLHSIMITYPTGNEGPVILSVTMPDSIRRPGADSIAVGTIVVQLTDVNGHEDVQTCYLMFQKPDGSYSSGSPISLYDDGVQNFSTYLWDETAGDGKFSRYLIIDSGNQKGTYNSYFYARDYSGILSEPFITQLVVY